MAACMHAKIIRSLIKRTADDGSSFFFKLLLVKQLQEFDFGLLGTM